MHTGKLAGLVLGILGCTTVRAQEASPAVAIPAERLDLKPGDPLSGRALVSRPRPIRGVLSWGLEARRHRGTFSCQALSPDGRRLATGGLDGTVRIWDVASGKLVRALVGHGSYVYGLDWSPDGNTLASSGSFDATVRLWDVRTGRPLRVLKGNPSYVIQVQWSPDGQTLLCAGGESGFVVHWDAVAGKQKGKAELGRRLLDLSWHPHGHKAAIVGQELALQLFDADKNKVLRKLGDSTDGFRATAWSPDGKLLAASTAKETRLYDAESGTVKQTLKATASALAWAKDGRRLFLLAGAIQVWHLDKGTLGKSFDAPGAQVFSASPDGSQFISGDGLALTVHDGLAKTARRFDIAGTVPPWWWPGRPLVTGVGTPTLALWEPATGRALRKLIGHTSSVSTVVFSPNGKGLASASYDNTVRIWDVATGKTTRVFKGHAGAVLALAFAANGKWVASGGTDKQVFVWEAATGKVLHTLKGHPADVTALAWAPGSSTQLAAAGREGTLRIWTVRTGKAATLEAANELVSLAWSPDSKYLAGGQGDHRVQIWQVSTGRALRTLEDAGSPPQVSALAWSPSGRILAAGRGNHTMQLWEPRSGKKYFSIPTMAPVQHVAWTAGSSTVAASSQDRTARFFDAATGQLRALLLADDGQIVAVGQDGYFRAPDGESALVAVVQTYKEQETLTLAEFAAKHRWKNVSAKVLLAGK